MMLRLPVLTAVVAATALITGPTAVATQETNGSIASTRSVAVPSPQAESQSLSPAAEEIDNAVAGTPPSDMSCDDFYPAVACFAPYGDHIWVQDPVADRLAAYGYWENDLKDSSGNWVFYRNGRCENHLGAGHWGQCNKDFYENSTSPNALGGKGSRICIWAEASDGEVDPYHICVLNDA